MSKKQDLEGRIVGMHELVFSLKFEGIPLNTKQMAIYRNHIAQLEAQLTTKPKEAKR